MAMVGKFAQNTLGILSILKLAVNLLFDPTGSGKTGIPILQDLKGDKGDDGRDMYYDTLFSGAYVYLTFINHSNSINGEFEVFKIQGIVDKVNAVEGNLRRELPDFD